MAVCRYLWRYSLCINITLLLKMKYYILLIAILLLTSSAEAQCAMCRAVLESEEGMSTAKGINNGIIYLMAIPYILVGGLGFIVYRKLRNN